MNIIALPTPARIPCREPIAPATAETITRHHQPGADFTVVRRPGLNELHITIQPEPDDSVALLLRRLDAILREHEAVVVRMEVFGAVAARAEFLTAMWKLMGETAWPVMWIDGAGFEGNAIAGLHVYAAAGVEIESISVGGRVIGRVFSDSFARHCLLGDIAPRRARASRAEQAREVFEAMRTALDRAGMGVHHLARTWFYLDRLRDWHGDFDRVRTEVFQQWGVFDSGVPASTGIGARNPRGVAVIAGAWATAPMNDAMKVRPVRSPLEHPSDGHGGGFARGMEWDTPGHRCITVSDTMSTAFGGASAHKGDINAQVDLTMDVVEAILVSRGLDFADVTRATAYVKLPRHAGALDDWFERRGLWFPTVITHAAVRRDDLLFGVELDAIMEKPARRSA